MQKCSPTPVRNFQHMGFEEEGYDDSLRGTGGTALADKSYDIIFAGKRPCKIIPAVTGNLRSAIWDASAVPTTPVEPFDAPAHDYPR